MMTERSYRLILGGILMALLYLHQQVGLAIYIGWLLIEGITNWRLPFIISKVLGRPQPPAKSGEEKGFPINFEAERALRFSIAGLLGLSFFVFPDLFWFFPWFMAFALILAGITGICPMVMLLKKIGFR